MNWKKLLLVLVLLVIVGLTMYFKESTNTTIDVDGWYTSK